MANKKKDNKVNKRAIKLADFIQSNIDKLYQTTYYTNPSNKKDLNDIKSKIDASIDTIISNSNSTIGIPNISKMYSRIYDKQNTNKNGDMVHGIEELLTDKGLVDNTIAAFTENSRLTDLDLKIDTIIKYMPKLQEALDVRKDNVLSADHFSKDFITIANNTDVDKNAIFSKRLKEIKDKYNLLELFEDVYDNASKYGEQFIYNVPHKKALEKLLATKNAVDSFTTISNFNTESGEIVCESGDVFKMSKPSEPIDKNLKINLEINTSGMLTSVIENFQAIKKNLSKVNEQSLCIEASLENQTTVGSNKLSKNIDSGFMPNSDELDFSAFDDDNTATDGLIYNKKNSKQNKINIDIPGCIIKKLDRKNIIPVYIEDYCMGYYYIETSQGTDITDFTKMEDPMMTLRGNSTIIQKSDDNIKRDATLRYIAGEMSKYIDQQFINNNQDLRDEIYMILKYNDTYNNPNNKFRVTFLPPEDVTHIYFKKDPVTHRGISDLEKAIIPATLYASMYITNSIAAMTRSQDKRVYYVKQTVDTNISKTLLNTIEQIKKSNFNIRQIENINHILNISGRFNDYVIPESANGEAPIRMEVLQGQNVDVKTDLMTILEEMAINTTDVPLELIAARQSIDYAVQLTMTNSKFLRMVYKRQSKYEKFLSKIITKIYNYEFDENSILDVKLPPPMFLNITNTNQILQNSTDYAANIAEIYLANETDDEVKNTFMKNIKLHFLGSYIDRDAIETILTASKLETAHNQNNSGNNEE